MKKLYISCPMKGRTDEAIKASIEFMKKYAELVTGEEYEVIDSFFEDEKPDGRNSAVRGLGHGIQLMADADCVVGLWASEDMWRGCGVERAVAQRYGIKFVEVPYERCKVFEDCVELERHRWDHTPSTVLYADGTPVLVKDE